MLWVKGLNQTQNCGKDNYVWQLHQLNKISNTNDNKRQTTTHKKTTKHQKKKKIKGKKQEHHHHQANTTSPSPSKARWLYRLLLLSDNTSPDKAQFGDIGATWQASSAAVGDKIRPTYTIISPSLHISLHLRNHHPWFCPVRRLSSNAD